MAELFRQLAFINALLGGFAITFLSAMLVGTPGRRVVDWLVSVLTAAAACFILGALGATFSAVVVADAGQGVMPATIAVLHKVLSLLFLAGTTLLFASLGMCGWLRSRGLGKVTAVIAAVAIVGGYFVIEPFLR